jgi:hypothetical protein
MQRVVPLFIAVLIAGCRTQPSAPAPAPEARSSAVEAVTVSTLTQAAEPDPTRLPEDPVAGKLSTLQWQEHLKHEEDERQALFDKPRLAQHRALVKLIEADRARYDRARSEAALAKVRADMPKQLEEIRKRMQQIDHWGTNSRVLPDYDALANVLSGAYADAKLAALKGEPAAYERAHAEFEQRLEKIEDWLHEVAEGDEEEARERE